MEGISEHPEQGLGLVLSGALSRLLTQPGGSRQRRWRSDEAEEATPAFTRLEPNCQVERFTMELKPRPSAFTYPDQHLEFQGLKRFRALKGLTLNSISMS